MKIDSDFIKRIFNLEIKLKNKEKLIVKIQTIKDK